MPSTARNRTDKLCAVLDPLPHPERLHQLALRAGKLSAKGKLRPVLDELSGRGPYERGLAVVAASAGRDADWIAARLGDPDRYVRGHALRTADGLGIPDSAYAAALDDAPAVVRRDLLRALAAGRRPALADRLIDAVRADWGDPEAARLLPGCGPDTVVRLLPGLFPAVRGFQALARRHPALLLGAAADDLAAQPPAEREQWWDRYGQAVALSLPADPARALDLLSAHPPLRLPEPLRERLGLLASAEPERLLRLLLTPFGRAVAAGGHVHAPAVRRLAAHAPWDLVVEYGRTMGEQHAAATLLKATAPARREELYLAMTDGLPDDQGPPATWLLDALPAPAATARARRAVHHARNRGASWLSVAQAEVYLPPDEVRQGLLAATRRPLAGDRKEAWRLLVRNAVHSHDPAALEAVLAELPRLRNEQHPVRSAALVELSRTSVRRLPDGAAAHLDLIVRDALDARDTDQGTRYALSQLAVRVLREPGGSEGTQTGSAALPEEQRAPLRAWALRTLVRIARSAGEIHLPGRGPRQPADPLGPGPQAQLLDALLPVLETAAAKGDHRLTLALAKGLGAEVWERSPEVGELLWRAARSTDNDTARKAIDLWLAPPAGRGEKTARLLAEVPAAAVLPSVLAVLTTARTDLLDHVLGTTPPEGRFVDDPPWLLPVGRLARHWTPRQQRLAEQQLAGIAADGDLWEDDRTAALLRLAELPGIGADAVRRRTDDPEPVVAEAALAALARTDRPADTLPELLALAGTDRAGTAVYAATGASRHARPSQLAELLRGVLAPASGARVTSRKEAVRLSALRLPRPDAAELVTMTYALPGQHQDVRAACVAHGARLVAAGERVWHMLEDAARGAAGNAVAAAVLRVSPGDLSAPYRERYAQLIREVCRTDDRELLGTALRSLRPWARWWPGAADLLVRVVTDLDDREAWHGAAEGLAEGATDPVTGRAVLRALDELARADGSWVPSPEADRDLPARRRLESLVESLCRPTESVWGGPRPETARPVLREAGTALAAHPAFVPQAAGLLVRGLELEGTGPGPGEGLTALARLLEGRPVLAAATAETLHDRLTAYGTPEGDPDLLLPEAARLTAAGTSATGLLAESITAACGERLTWPPEWRDLLTALRSHAIPDVRDAALAREWF